MATEVDRDGLPAAFGCRGRSSSPRSPGLPRTMQEHDGGGFRMTQSISRDTHSIVAGDPGLFGCHNDHVKLALTNPCRMSPSADGKGCNGRHGYFVRNVAVAMGPAARAHSVILRRAHSFDSVWSCSYGSSSRAGVHHQRNRHGETTRDVENPSAVPRHLGRRTTEITYLLNHSGACGILVRSDLAAHIDPAIQQAGAVTDVIVAPLPGEQWCADATDRRRRSFADPL